MCIRDRVKAVHDYIVLNGKYDNNSLYFSDYDLLTKGTSVCNGYALLTYNMLNKLNIPVNFVSGTASGEAHIWNMVKLDGYWFHLDVTWNDPVLSLIHILTGMPPEAIEVLNSLKAYMTVEFLNINSAEDFEIPEEALNAPDMLEGLQQQLETEIEIEFEAEEEL